MTSLAIASAGTYGVFLVYSALVFGWSGARPVPGADPTHRVPASERFVRWMGQAGLGDVSPTEFLGVAATVGILGTGLAAIAFGGVVPALVCGAFCATAPIASYQVRRANRLAVAHDAWPHLIEEIRVLTGSAGRSVPQALIDVGLRGPEELRPAFRAAHREWVLTTDFERTTDLLRNLLADPTADATCETLLVAHEVGGGDLDRRLAELAEDRRIESLGRKEARAKQAGVRFARRFVVAVPAGMAVAGMSLGDGRAAYTTPTGQILVAVAVVMVGLCWGWSGSMLRLPAQARGSWERQPSSAGPVR